MGRTRRFLIALCAAVAFLAAGSLIVLRSGRPLYYTDGQSGIIASALADALVLDYQHDRDAMVDSPRRKGRDPEKRGA